MSIKNVSAETISTVGADGTRTISTDRTTSEKTKRRERLADLAAVAAFLLLGVYLTSGLLPDPGGLHVKENWKDSVQNQWFLLHATRMFTHGESPIFTTLINWPYGVNLMANTSILAFAIPLTPITLLCGAGMSSYVLLTLAPTATAIAWYHVLSRHIVTSRTGAFIGAAFAGFSPAMVSHNVGHPNIVAQFLIPYMVLTVLRLRIPGRAVRTGLELAGLVIIQIFINEEVLFITAVTILLVILITWVSAPQEILPHVRSAFIAAGVATGVAGTVLAYPLWHQFFGPMAYQGLPAFVLDYGSDLASFPAFSSESLAAIVIGDKTETISANPTEQNAFFGLPLLVFLVIVAVQLFRQTVARAMIYIVLILGVLSLGSTITVNGKKTDFHGPWMFISHLPVFDSVVPTRLSLFMTPPIAILLAMSINHIKSNCTTTQYGHVNQKIWISAIILALIPIAPTPIDVADNPEPPRFFTSQEWKKHLPTGSRVLPIPLGWEQNTDVMRWQFVANAGFVTPGGYYLAPEPTGDDRRARFGPTYVPTVTILTAISESGSGPRWDMSREQALTDMKTWRVDAIVMPDNSAYADDVRTTIDQLFGPSRHITDVWLWDIRHLTHT